MMTSFFFFFIQRGVYLKTSYIDDFGVHFMSLNAFEYTCWLQESGAGVRKSKKKNGAKKRKG